jgi:hypothetical protein
MGGGGCTGESPLSIADWGFGPNSPPVFLDTWVVAAG